MTEITVDTDELEKIRKTLSREPERNISVLGFLRMNPGSVKNAFYEGVSIAVVVENAAGERYAFLHGDDEVGVGRLVERLYPEVKTFSSVEDRMMPAITQGRVIKSVFPTRRYVLPDDVEIAPPAVPMRRLDGSFAEYVKKHYEYDYLKVEYARDRLEKGISAGVFDGDSLVAWGMTHDDGALGTLYVLPEVRGRGYGEAVTRALIIEKRKAGEPVFLNVLHGNVRSSNLVEKMGFVFDRNASWVELA
ncbi:MAG: hypothetical protein CVT48_04435 [Thermoplasmata archaeon HGW-Thermoplasmata-1]|nr:MAG: hypothetical protein CVT48_04435 [Thermoplasmata archaeon HGW-Thermoplasmata-1]